MIRINLAPQVDQSTGRNQLLRDVILVGIVCAVAYYGIEHHSTAFDKQIEIVDTKISELQKSKANMKREFERAAEIRKKTDEIKARSIKVRQLGEGRKISIMLLDSLQSKHPERMWFTKIAYSTKNKSLVLSGYALDHTVIADYMKRLKEIGKIEATDHSDLRDFIPPQILNSELKPLASAIQAKGESHVLEQVTLKQLISSEEVQGVTLQKFEINIRLTNG